MAKEKIKAYVSYDETTKTRYWREFELANTLPEVGDKDSQFEIVKVREMMIDSDQGNDKIYDYDFYEITKIDHTLDDDEQYLEENKWTDYICIEKSNIFKTIDGNEYDLYKSIQIIECDYPTFMTDRNRESLMQDRNGNYYIYTNNDRSDEAIYDRPNEINDFIEKWINKDLLDDEQLELINDIKKIINRPTVLKEARIKKKLSQQKLASLMNVDIRTIQKWEAGDRNPEFENIKKLCKILDIDLNEL